MSLFFFKRKERGERIYKKAAAAAEDAVRKLVLAHRKSKEEWAAQPKEARETFFWSKVCMGVILLPSFLVTIVSWKIALISLAVISPAGILLIYRRNRRLSVVPMFCCVLGLFFGLIAKAVLYLMMSGKIRL